MPKAYDGPVTTGRAMGSTLTYSGLPGSCRLVERSFMPKHCPKTRGRAWAAVVIGLFLIVLGVLGGVASLSFLGPWPAPFGSQCLYRMPPAGALVSEASIPTPSFSWWPMGIACRFPATTGSAQLVSEPSWEMTLYVLGSLAAVIVGLVIASYGMRSVRDLQEVLHG